MAHFFLPLLLFLTACSPASDAPVEVKLPVLDAAAYHWITARTYEHEALGQTKLLTYWGEGEDFPSLGIGHFIWFPQDIDAPFDESFPGMVDYLREHGSACVAVPDWLDSLEPFDAPWRNKRHFDDELHTERMIELRHWLAATAIEQTQYIVASFVERWNRLQLAEEDKASLNDLLQRLVQSPAGMSAVVDYYNFKGLGSNLKERYAGQGWGLVQVLGDIVADSPASGTDLVERFGQAAAHRLTMRVQNAPPERNEARWLEGWLKRVGTYTNSAPDLPRPASSQYRVMPYLQMLSAGSISLQWFSDSPAAGRVVVKGAQQVAKAYRSAPTLACDLAYHLAEFQDLLVAQPLPYRHAVDIENLAPGMTYHYEVTQDGEVAAGDIRMPADDLQSVRFIVYGDSETEPESTGKHALWPRDGEETRRYLVDQTDGYAANLSAIAKRDPDFVAIAGDLVQSGGEQRDWDEFWQHNAALAASVPIVPALGNHEYFGGPGDLGGYSSAAATRALGKYQAYFDVQPYYSLEYGPLALIVVDGNSGLPDRSEQDTNWYLSSDDGAGVATAWNLESGQLAWLRAALEDAQREKEFTFVMFHAPPYSSGVHGKPPGVGEGESFASGRPLRELTAMFLRYGVDAVFNGHDEMYEHSVLRGIEEHPSGGQSPHSVHFFTVGIGGDGLRGPDASAENPQRVFLAHSDAEETYDDSGVLLDGGKHYGHLEVDISRSSDGNWQAQINPVYVFPLVNGQGEVNGFERRVYDDVSVLGSAHDD